MTNLQDGLGGGQAIEVTFSGTNTFLAGSITAKEVITSDISGTNVADFKNAIAAGSFQTNIFTGSTIVAKVSLDAALGSFAGLVEGTQVVLTGSANADTFTGSTFTAKVSVDAALGSFAGLVEGTTIAATGSVIATGIVSSRGHEALAAATGSPSVFTGVRAQYGQGTIGGGSHVWVVPGTSFKAAPFVVVSSDVGQLDGVTVGSVVAGSFNVRGDTASKTFSWMAIGSL